MTFTGSIVVDAALSRLRVDFVSCSAFSRPEAIKPRARENNPHLSASIGGYKISNRALPKCLAPENGNLSYENIPPRTP
jgi:hypothetical protein